MNIRLMLTLFCFIVATASAVAQTAFVGFGPTYSLPLDTLGVTNKGSFGGSVLIGSRKYCQLWTGVRLNYTALQRKTDSTKLYYGQAITLSPEVRYFFVQPLSVPFYLQGMIELTGIDGTDSASHSGLGAGIGAGYLFHYNSNCCDWFIDLYAHYQMPNLIARSSLRPSFSDLLFGVSFNLGL